MMVQYWKCDALINVEDDMIAEDEWNAALEYFASSEVYEADGENVIPIGYCMVPCKVCLRLDALPLGLGYICLWSWLCFMDVLFPICPLDS